MTEFKIGDFVVPNDGGRPVEILVDDVFYDPKWKYATLGDCKPGDQVKTSHAPYSNWRTIKRGEELRVYYEGGGWSALTHRIYGYEPAEAPAEPEEDAVRSPSHYELPGEVIDLIKRNLTEEEFRGYCKGNAIKYVCRGGHKDGEDVEKDWAKAGQYFEFMENK